ncbi:MAG: hypothetical protein KAH18_12265 [Psychromonas sp.]|nr:hypothetical protein [Psychromonas sp.]
MFLTTIKMLIKKARSKSANSIKLPSTDRKKKDKKKDRYGEEKIGKSEDQFLFVLLQEGIKE